MSSSCSNCGGNTENEPDAMVLCDDCIKDDRQFVERLQDERDRYRSALERIKQVSFRMGWYTEVAAITREALKN